MKKTEHPVQLPDSLINKWLEDTDTSLSVQFQEAAEWGANVELEACCAWFIQDGWNSSHPTKLREARRPKPPSLKEQALDALQFVDEKLDLPLHNHCNAIHTIRAALEALPE
jgi:hypothetical protein